MIATKLKLPKSINDITLKDYQKYMKIYEANKDNDTTGFLDMKLIEIVCGVDLITVNKMPVDEFEAVGNYISELFKEETPLLRRFKITGTDDVTIEFGFIPNLSKISLGEYIDLDNYLGNVEDWHKAMAVLFRPVPKQWSKKEFYNITEYEGTEKHSYIMQEMPLGIALGAMVFFYRLGMKLSIHTMNFSMKALEEMELSEEQNQLLQESMDGIKASMPSLEEMLLDLTRLPIYKSTKP
jgi:hypothetical protein